MKVYRCFHCFFSGSRVEFVHRAGHTAASAAKHRIGRHGLRHTACEIDRGAPAAMLLVGDVESQVARFAVLEKRHGKGVVDHPVGLGFRADVMVADILRRMRRGSGDAEGSRSRRRLVTVDDDRVDRVDADIGLGLVVYVVDARDTGFAGRSLDARIAQATTPTYPLASAVPTLLDPALPVTASPSSHIGIDSAYEGRFDASRQHRGECKKPKSCQNHLVYRHSGTFPWQGSATCLSAGCAKR